ncbi:MAG: hypothetical protein OXI71_09825 [Gemmatimonadota bacterium]|nr:hypothetical protein [Gemmatimonadota bacterium]
MTECIDWTTVTIATPETSPAFAVTIVVPLPTAVTRPAESTAATSVSPLDQDTVSSSIGRPIWSRTSTASRIVCPTAVNARVSGVTATVVGAAASTATTAFPVTADEVAVISASPAATPVTSPKSSTRATAVSLDAHENSAPAAAWPFASDASAESLTVSATTSVSAGGVTATALTSCATVTDAVPDAEPAVAVTVAVPLAAAVTKPDASTVATEALLLAQATDAAAITCPCWSRTSAVNRAVAPSADSTADAGVTVTEVGRGGSDGGSTAPSPQPDAHTATDSMVTPVTTHVPTHCRLSVIIGCLQSLKFDEMIIAIKISRMELFRDCHAFFSTPRAT